MIEVNEKIHTEPEWKTINEMIVLVGTVMGSARTYDSRKRGLICQTKSGEKSGTRDICSAIAEFFFYDEQDIQYTWRVLGSNKLERDVGPFEIESVMYRENRNLLLREYDLRSGVPPETPYVLVQLINDEGNWQGRIRGWMRLGEGLVHPHRMSLYGTNGVWIINEELLHPMIEFRHEY